MRCEKCACPLLCCRGQTCSLPISASSMTDLGWLLGRIMPSLEVRLLGKAMTGRILTSSDLEGVVHMTDAAWLRGKIPE
eukprot:1160158-Pelagomonas_calceolata.AAC.6